MKTAVQPRKIWILFFTMLSVVFLPWIGAIIHHKGSLPDGFFSYPPLAPIAKSPFNWTIWTVFAIIFLLTTCLYFFPKLFLFKKMPTLPPLNVKKVKLPFWFWVGLAFWGSSLFLLWTKSHNFTEYLHWSDMWLFWGLTLMIDGWVYVRNGGKSLVASVPQELLGIAVASMFGWMLFEFLNFFVDDDWYYPKGDIISREQFLLYAIMISSGLMPLAFQWYSLFQTYPNFRQRFSNGPKIIIPKWIKNIAFLFSFVSLLGAGLFPDMLFFSLWLAPPLLLAIILDKLGVWSPVNAIGQGNWSPALLFGLTYLFAGLCLEGQNYFSGIHQDGVILFTEAPAYWKYDLPYVNRFHLFEMPILGYVGYLPFGLFCWLWWISFATLLGIPSQFFKEQPLVEN